MEADEDERKKEDELAGTPPSEVDEEITRDQTAKSTTLKRKGSPSSVGPV